MTELAPFQVARPRDVEAAIALCCANAQSRYSPAAPTSWSTSGAAFAGPSS